MIYKEAKSPTLGFKLGSIKYLRLFETRLAMFAPVLLLLGAIQLARAAHIRGNNACLNGKSSKSY
jgi:hypothetical protein